jgi:hypothetical protein
MKHPNPYGLTWPPKEAERVAQLRAFMAHSTVPHELSYLAPLISLLETFRVFENILEPSQKRLYACETLLVTLLNYFDYFGTIPKNFYLANKISSTQ